MSMWKKGDSTPDDDVMAPEPMARREAPRAQSGASQRATIGRSITIKGEVTGDEDLLIQGTVEGSVDLKQRAVTVGPEGDVKADIHGRIVTVEGSVEGDLYGEEQVVLKSTAKVSGDIKSPRVSLEDGATFRGGIDMGDRARDGARRDAAARRMSEAPAPHSTTQPSAPSASKQREQAGT